MAWIDQITFNKNTSIVAHIDIILWQVYSPAATPSSLLSVQLSDWVHQVHVHHVHHVHHVQVHHVLRALTKRAGRSSNRLCHVSVVDGGSLSSRDWIKGSEANSQKGTGRRDI